MTPEPTTLIVVPHTHWDREWYQTFQQFRMRLVRCVDHVLRVLESDPAFTFFMLDGQTVVLADYLEVRPEEAERLVRLARAGRLLVGPWYIQPDEFLVGGEAIIRNLLLGRRMAAPYGGAMPIGYAPDCFGHIAQLPQILAGFGLDNAMFMRGVGKDIAQSEFWWEAPDGTRIRGMYLCGSWGYSNASNLPLQPDELAKRLERIVEPMLPYATTNAILLMNGSDHLEPQDGLPAALAAANERLAARGWRAEIGTLPQYVQRVRDAGADLTTYRGEFRESQITPLLPGVLSARMWIKQRNAAGEELLARWADPFAAWAGALGAPQPPGLLDVAWRFLLQNQPHDSICGCSIDQVHREMVPRYDQSAQIADQVTTEALEAIARRVRTGDLASAGVSGAVVVVFSATGAEAAIAEASVQVAAPVAELVVLDDAGNVVPHVATEAESPELFHQTVEKDLVESLLAMLEAEGRIGDYHLQGATLHAPDAAGTVRAFAAVTRHGPVDDAATADLIAQVRALAAQADVRAFDVTIAESPWAHLRFVARDMPAQGGRALLVRGRRDDDPAPPASEIVATATSIENAWLRVAVDPLTGELTLTEKATGATYPGLHRFQDGGDVGDLYNYSPPRDDLVITGLARPPVVELLTASAVEARLRITAHLDLPARCAADRQSRSAERTECRAVTEVALFAGARRVELRTSIANHAHDHRLRVLFPVPFVTATAEAEGTFMVNRRPSHRAPPPGGWAGWIEDPIDTQPQKRFVSVSDGARGLTVLNQGLPEYEVLPAGTTGGVTVALTLLRCVDWLSRDDFATRRGHAGPMLPTPEGQMDGAWTCEYALVPHAGTWRDADALAQREAHAFNAGTRAVATDLHAGPLPPRFALASLAPASLVLSTVKRADDGQGIIVRWYNPLDTAVTARLATTAGLTAAARTSLDETAATPLVPAGDGAWEVPTPAGGIVSLRLT